jgi:hypothetical protein
VKAAEAELVKLRTKTKSDAKIIEDLTRERALLSQKVRDRDEELRGKARFLEVGNVCLLGWVSADRFVECPR